MKKAFLDNEKLLFEENYARVFQALYMFCGSYTLTEDAVQESFYIACKNFNQLRNKEHFAAWVTAIGINKIKSEHRKKSRYTFVDIEKVVDKLVYEADEYEMLEEKEQVKKLLDILKDDHKEFIILRYFFDLSLSEISELKNKSKGAVKLKLHRAMAKLRSYLQEEGVALDK